MQGFFNNNKNKNHMIISMYAEKSFGKTQHQFMIKKQNKTKQKKTSSESGHRGNILQHNKGHI